MSEMTKRERLQATVAGQATDRAPIAFWRHWPIDDQDAAALAYVALEYQMRNTAHRERCDRSIVNAPIGHRERSAATLAVG